MCINIFNKKKMYIYIKIKINNVYIIYEFTFKMSYILKYLI